MPKVKKRKSTTQLELIEPTYAALVALDASATIDEIRDRVIEVLKSKMLCLNNASIKTKYTEQKMR